MLAVSDEGLSDMLARKNAVLEAINRIFSTALSAGTEEQLARVCLGVAEELTGADFAFVGEVNATGDGFDELAISDRGRRAFDAAAADRPAGKVPAGLKMRGLYGRVVISGTSLIANDADAHPDGIGTPPGHPPLRSFLGVPLKQAGMTTGVIALGNRPGGFRPEDAETVAALVPAILQALANKRTSDALMRRDEQLRAAAERHAFLLELAGRLHGSDTPRQVIGVASRMLGAHVRAARVLVGEVDEDGRCDALHHGWLADDAAPLASELVWRDTAHPLLAELAGGGTIRVADAGDEGAALPDTLRAWLRHAGVASCVCVPLVMAGDCVLHMMAQHDTPRAWSDAEVELIEAVASRVAEALRRARGEEALRTSEIRYRSLFETMPQGYCEMEMVRDQRGRALGSRLLRSNPAFERLVDMPAGDAAIGRGSDTRHPLCTWRLETFDRIVKGGRPERFEHSLEALGRWCEVFVHPAAAAGEEGGECFVAMYNDITERRRASEALRDSELRLQTLIQGIPQLVWRSGEGGAWTWCSPQWSRFTGMTAAQSHGYGWLAALHPDDREAAMCFWSEASKAGQLEMEGRLHDASRGEYRWFQTRAVAVRDGDGTIVEWLGTSTDIHERRQLVERQQLLVAELQHRVRNILAVIRAIFARTIEIGHDMDTVAEHFRGRLDALARTQVIVTQSANGRVDLENLIRDELLSVGVGDGDRVRLAGPEVTLPPKTAESIGLAIHELTTNALKYGALKVPGAVLDVCWSINMNDGVGGRLSLYWTEQGVPVMPLRPQRKGFGSELIEEALPYRLGAETRLEFRRGGVRCQISVLVAPREHGVFDGV